MVKFLTTAGTFNMLSLTVVIFIGCNDRKPVGQNHAAVQTAIPVNYGSDRTFLQQHRKNLVELTNEKGNEKIIVSPEDQGRVMTSTSTGDSGYSNGWLNYKLISAGTRKKHFNPVGGEERFWLGPEGGQYSIYFKGRDSFNINHWQVPPVIDTASYEVVKSEKGLVAFSADATVKNYSGTVFNITIRRQVELLDKKRIEEKLKLVIPNGISCVAFETNNQIINKGPLDWKKETGLLSIWLLGMMTPSPKTMVVIPFLPGKKSFDYLTDNYFGNIPAERLQKKDSILFFTCDGKFRSKIGLSPLIAKSIAASFDFEKNVLTLILFPVDRKGWYVNSKWEIQKQPYQGDVVNSYNDGPLQDGTQLGPFYEIESSSPVQELKKGERLQYNQTTCHFTGSYNALRQLAKKALHINLDEFQR